MMTDKQNRTFERWISDHKGLVFKVVHASAVTSGDRNDLFLDIAIQLWKSIPGFKGDSKESMWIFRVALNTAALWKRKEFKHRTRTESHEDLDAVIKENPVRANDQLEWLCVEIRKTRSHQPLAAALRTGRIHLPGNRGTIGCHGKQCRRETQSHQERPDQFFFLRNSKPAWLWFAFAFCMLLSVRQNRREIRNKLIPKKQELEALRRTLTDQ